MEYSLQNLITNPGLLLLHRVRGCGVGPSAGAPCLILLHGVGASEMHLIDFAARQDPRLTVILARGPFTFGPGRYGWFTVNFTSGGPLIDAAQAEQSRRMLIEFIQALPAAYGVDPARIWIAGFSQGGIMSASIGLTRPERIAGFGLLSGRILPEISPLIAGTEALSRVEAFVSHGLRDGKLPIDCAHQARQLLSDKAVRLTYREYDAGHELNESMQHDFGEWIAAQLDAVHP